MILRHSEFSYLARYLTECISVFGRPIKGKQMCLYHGIDGDSTILNHLSCQYIAPISLTSLFEIVWSYSD